MDKEFKVIECNAQALEEFLNDPENDGWEIVTATPVQLPDGSFMWGVVFERKIEKSRKLHSF